MRKVKIILTIAVIGLITFFVIKSFVIPEEKGKVGAQENQFTMEIEKDIKALSKLPVMMFCKSSYINVKLRIDDFYAPHPPQYPHGRLGKSQLENDQRKENFSKTLYSTYADKFIKQSFYVFGKSDWQIDDLEFIRSEYRLLRSSPYLESGSPVDNKLGDIQRVFQKYDEINNFISSCNRFSFPNPSSKSSTVNIQGIENIQNRFIVYRQNILNNQYLRNCAHLLNRLNSVPNIIFQNHVQHLDRKISRWSGFYNLYNSQITYRETLYDLIKTEIEEIDRNLYGNIISTIDDERIRLLEKWNADASNAYIFFNQLNNGQNEN